MKPLHATLALFVVAASAITARSQTLDNPSFETAGSTNELALGWHRWGQWFNRETGWKPTVTGQCILGYHHWRITSPDDSGIYQDEAGVVRGAEYTFGIHANVDRAKDNKKDAGSIEVRLEATVDGKQQTLASKTYRLGDLRTDLWEKLSVTGKAINSTLRVLLIVSPDPDDQSRGGAIRFDDAFLNRSN